MQPLTPEEREHPTPPPPPIGAAVQRPGASGPSRAPSDLNCIACGYSLAGLETAAKCPECGRPVSVSLEQGLLRFADPMWLDSLKRGATTVAYGMGIGVAVSFLANLAMQFTGSVALALVAGLASLVGFLSKWIGVWAVAAPNPALRAGDSLGPGPMIRKAILVQIVAMVSVIPLALLGALSGAGFTFIALGTVLIAAMIAWVVEIVGAMRLVRHLAIRVPDQRLAKWAGVYSWLVPILMTVGALVIVGPLVGMILYIAAFSWLRGAIDRARFSQQGVGPQGAQPVRHAA